MDAAILARLQFAANISFHILFPAINIALAWILLFFKVAYQKTNDFKWMEAYQFWVKVFALCFALGIVSGVTMSFQFGTNWPGFMIKVGNVAGPLLAYEVLTAFFLEASFLGIMLFGFRRVSPKLHTLSTFLVAIGTYLSAFWILSLNSWMQTPVGFEIKNGIAHPLDWWAILFNPSMPYRLIHMTLASGLTAAFFVAGISAYRYQKGDQSASVSTALKTGIYLAAILVPLQVWVGDKHGLNTLKYQPAKIAAMEGIWKTGKAVPWHIFAWPNAKTQENQFELSIPYGSSLILTHQVEGEIKGLDAFPNNHPPVAPLFFAFRLMMGIGVLMLLFSWTGTWYLWKGRTLPNWWHKGMVWMTFSGWAATLSGWYVTEIGRQPWLVYGVLHTHDALAPNVGAGMVWTSLAMYFILYIVLIISFVSVLFYMARKRQGPSLIEKSQAAMGT